MQHQGQYRADACWGLIHPSCTLQVNHWIPFGPWGSDKGSLQVPTIKPVMLEVRGVNHEQHVMTGAFLDWVAFQLSGQRSSALTHNPKSPGGLLLEAEGHRNTTHNVHAEHRPLLRRLGRGSGMNLPETCPLLQIKHSSPSSPCHHRGTNQKPNGGVRVRQRCDQISQ